MIGLSSFVFLIAVTLNAYPETMNVGDIAFAVNFTAVYDCRNLLSILQQAYAEKNLQAWPYF